MIKINLIQRTASPKKAIFNVVIEIVIFSIVLIVALLGIFTHSRTQSSRKTDINNRIRREREEQNRLRTVIDKVNELKRAAEVVERKVDIIQQLKEQQQGPAELMQVLVRARPENLQLIGVREQGGNIRLTGRATNTFAAANFVRDLRGTELFEEVDILRQTISSVRDVSYHLYEFEIVCKLK